MKTTNCVKCRKRIFQEAEKAYLSQGYEFFVDSARSMAIYAVCGVLTAMVQRGRTKKYIQQIYKDMCFVFDTPECFGKKITMEDIMAQLEKEYDIDWSKLKLHTETEKEFITSARKEKKHEKAANH